MRKLLCILSTISLTTSFMTTIVSCKIYQAQYADNWVKDKSKKIMLITDAGSVNDKSFNETAWNAVEQFQKEHQSQGYKAQALEPAIDTDIPSNYDAAIYADGYTWVLPGFKHGDYLPSYFQDSTENYNKTRIVWLDATNAIDEPNLARVVFKSYISGFYVGLAMAIFLQESVPQDQTLKASTFGGLDSNGVTDYMFGYKFGIQYWNKYKEQLIKDLNLEDKITKPRDVLFVNKQGEEASTNMGSHDFWFTGSFAKGAGRSTADLMVANGVNAIFPVAGVQTEDVLEAVRNAPNSYVAGVDVDQYYTYEQNSKIPVSALKKMDIATLDILKALYSDNPNDAKQYFHTGVTSRNEWSGISPIHSNDQTLANLSEKLEALDRLKKEVTKLEEQWNEILAKSNGANLWNYAFNMHV